MARALHTVVVRMEDAPRDLTVLYNLALAVASGTASAQPFWAGLGALPRADRRRCLEGILVASGRTDVPALAESLDALVHESVERLRAVDTNERTARRTTWLVFCDRDNAAPTPSRSDAPVIVLKQLMKERDVIGGRRDLR